MSFNSLAFIFAFMPVVLLGFHFLPRTEWRNSFLLLASLVFYGLTGLSYLILLLAEMLWVYSMTASPRFPGSQWRLGLAITIPLAGLVYFKYLGFLLQDVFGLPPALLQGTAFSDILLPAGISFFTFELLSYSFDRYRRQLAEPAGFTNFALFVTFFRISSPGQSCVIRNWRRS